FEGYVHLCLLDGRTLFCFSSIAADEIAVPKDLGVVKDFKVGMRHACGSTDSGWRCWGDGSYFENIFRWPEFELGDFDSKIYDHHEYCFMQNGRPACNNGHTPSGDLIGVRKVVIGPTHGDACALTVEGVRCWGNSYGSPLQVPIPTELQNISPRLNTEALNNFLGCYSRGFTLLKKISARQTYPDGGRIEQVELNQLVDVFAATDDIIKVLPGKEAIVISDTEKIYSSNGGFSPPHQALRVYQKDDGTFAISSPHGVVQGLKRENCPR
ncbi:MAG TPA: hypothetical protein VN132_06660, partial [Bdellovibrio sp.]|nr:hypothetical protein [Bdellovibrio sp.]